MDVSALFEDFYKEFPELREESQLDMGKKVEKEHEPTVEWIKDEVQTSGEVPPNKEIYASIATDHLNEFPTYYTALDKMEQGLKEAQDLNEGNVGTFIKGVGQKIGQSASNALGKIPLIKAGQQAVQQSATSEAVLQASDMKGYLENILNALRNYVNNKAPQTTAPTQPQQVAESFKLTESLLTFELEHLTEAMDQPTFQKLVAAYVKTVEDDPLKILQNPAYLNQLRGIFNGSKRFGLTLPVSLKDFERVIAEYSKTGPATNQAPVAGTATEGEIEPTTQVATQQVAGKTGAYSRMSPKLIELIQNPQTSASTMRIISWALQQVATTSQPAARLLKQLKS